MKLSVIIPAFRVAGTLRRCIESVVGQDVSFDYEIILIDDGSDDGTSEICDKLAVQFPLLTVIHQENKGLSIARNKGLDMAKGDYITFVDSDDELAPETLQPVMQIVDEHPEYDIVEYPFIKNYGGLGKPSAVVFQPRVYTSASEYWLGGQAYTHTYAWNKIYKHHLFNDVAFPEKRYFEDAFVLPRLIEKCRFIACTDKGRYRYYQNPNGITANADGNKLRDLLEANIIAMQKYCDERFYAYMLNIQIDVYEQTRQEPILPAMPYTSTTKLRMMHVIGMKNLCRLISWIHKIRLPHRS